jgi:hypothetical protein
LRIATAAVPAGALAQDRHLFVDNARALRSALTPDQVQALFQDATLNANGLEVASTTPLLWPNRGTGVEFAWPQSTSPWTEPRCAVVNVSSTPTGSVQINLQQPCWYNLMNKPCGQTARGPPAIVENVGLPGITQPNQFWLDPANRLLYYSLQPQQEPSSMAAFWPQSLMQQAGRISIKCLIIVKGAAIK